MDKSDELRFAARGRRFKTVRKCASALTKSKQVSGRDRKCIAAGPRTHGPFCLDRHGDAIGFFYRQERKTRRAPYDSHILRWSRKSIPNTRAASFTFTSGHDEFGPVDREGAHLQVCEATKPSRYAIGGAAAALDRGLLRAPPHSERDRLK